MEMNTTDWMQFYQGTLSAQALGQVSDPQIVLTTTSSTVIPPTIPATTSGGASTSGHLNSEGPVSKSAKRRRASRAAPTTLINTDASNFRAMVQQFTGISQSSLTFGSPNAQHIDFRAIQSTNFNMMACGEGQRNHHQQQLGNMFSLQNKRHKLDCAEGFFTVNTSSQMFPSSSTSSSPNNNNRNKLIFIS